MTAENGHSRTRRVLPAAVLAAAVIAAGYGLNVMASRPDGAAPSPAPPAPEDAPALKYASAVEPGGAEPVTLREAYPDYNPEDRDPEHEAVKRGRREVAVNDALTLGEGGSTSMETLVEQAIHAIDLGKPEVFTRLSVTREDFERLLWPEFPQSRPAVNVPAGEAWDFLHTRNMGGYSRALYLQGRGLELSNVRPGTVERFTNFTLHRDVEVDVSDATGAELDFPLIRTIVERHGRFKIYSAGD